MFFNHSRSPPSDCDDYIYSTCNRAVIQMNGIWIKVSSMKWGRGGGITHDLSVMSLLPFNWNNKGSMIGNGISVFLFNFELHSHFCYLILFYLFTWSYLNSHIWLFFCFHKGYGYNGVISSRLRIQIHFLSNYTKTKQITGFL